MSKISIESIEKRYGSVVAVRNVSLTVDDGEFVSLLGPSGSGKTTTLRIVAGLDRPTSGTIRIGNQVVSGPGVYIPTYKREIGMVFQSYAVWPHMTVAQNVTFPLRQRNRMATASRGRRVSEVLEMVGLAGYADRFPSQLSGGQQQRVALARALAAAPGLILFDEPLSNLDLRLRDSIRLLLKSLHRELKLTAIYVTHDQTEAMTLSDRIHVMDQGRVVQSGTAREALYETPQSLFVAKFVGQINAFPILHMDPNAHAVHLSCGYQVKVERRGNADWSEGRQLLIRPHWVRLLPASHQPAEGPNIFAGTILQIDYLGDRQRYVLGLSSGIELVAEVVPDPSLPEVGERVLVQLPPEHCRLV